MAEMTALEYFEIKKRITENDGNRCTIECTNCPISTQNNGTGLYCHEFEIQYPEKAIKIVQKWVEEHSRKTILQDFLEKYPNAPHRPDGTPIACPFYMGYAMCSFCNTGKCFDCWNRPLEDD